MTLKLLSYGWAQQTKCDLIFLTSAPLHELYYVSSELSSWMERHN